jgi:large subunit ribosomal protein L15
MADTLSKLAKPAGSTRTKTRLGRGVGSGLGKTAGRGQKGQYARTRGFKPHFEGGQTPIQRRLPKRGFRNPFSKVTAEVNVGDLDGFAAGANVDEQALGSRGLVKGRFDRIKILGSGELTKAVTVSAHAFSKSAAEKIQKAGGKVVLLGAPGASQQ